VKSLARLVSGQHFSDCKNFGTLRLLFRRAVDISAIATFKRSSVAFKN
jgi:hypothetical protein